MFNPDKYIKGITSYKTSDGVIFEDIEEAREHIVIQELYSHASKILGNVEGSYADPLEVLEFLTEQKELIAKYFELINKTAKG